MEELQEQGSSTFLEKSGRVSIHQNKWGRAFQLLHLYTDRASGKIRCPGKKKSRKLLPWRCFFGASCQHVLHQKTKLYLVERFRDLHQNLKNVMKSLGQVCLCGGSLFSPHGSAYGMKVRLQFKYFSHFIKSFSKLLFFFLPEFLLPVLMITNTSFQCFFLSSLAVWKTT